MISRGAHPGKSFSPHPAQTIRKGYYLRLLWEFFPNIFAPIALKMLIVLNFTHLCVQNTWGTFRKWWIFPNWRRLHGNRVISRAKTKLDWHLIGNPGDPFLVLVIVTWIIQVFASPQIKKNKQFGRQGKGWRGWGGCCCNLVWRGCLRRE